jgi:hypothetical protein
MTFTLVGLILDFVGRYPAASANLTGNVDAMASQMTAAGMCLDAETIHNAKTWLLVAEARLALPGKDGVYGDGDIRRVAVAAKSYLG